ncbi:MAG: maltose alpha-D-glucosyltransferase [Pirellulales bacterium]
MSHASGPIRRPTCDASLLTGAPQWFKDAVIYQLHVRAFHDSTGDGIGDFPGLTMKLDYIQELGVTTIWLQPFFPSPLKDDGYDTSDYCNVNPLYGTLRDFQRFLDEAHRRDLRVVTEMVMNHTSDQHDWFQKSRRAKPGSKWREYYVWSDTPNKYQDARVIFQDFEGSNWTWDPVAQAYFWHRFYHHQPDLNFDNPEVRREMLRAVDFWLDMGVDGFRLDAVPYLFEREGTNCENLPETHAFLRELRRHIDARHPQVLLLAEANQWPEDAAAYFGAGDECHMNFHFPLMPRMFMAIEREDRFPIHDILEQTPAIPDGCQWATFLRNHDELTLEMVTDEERDYMYRAYAQDAQARVNLGIRRRLAPLLRNNRRKIELMNAMLLSLPGTPIIYYGDELGMGDNIFLGDRNSVRTPMQWNADRNGGFSRANPQQLYLPVIIDAEYHYTSLNVEVEENSRHSLLWWMRKIIALRKKYPAFGRGSLELLAPDNPKVLAFLRQTPEDTLLLVMNLSRFAQCAELDLSRFRGQTPIELFGQTRFPPVGELPYFLTLGPYSFYWFRLSWPEAEVTSLGVELPSCSLPSGEWDQLLAGKGQEMLERVLPRFLKRQRWFAGKARPILDAQLVDVFEVAGGGKTAPMRLLLARVNYVEGDPDLYLIPVVFAAEEQARNILGDHPRAGILRLERGDGKPGATLCEAKWEQAFWRPVLETIGRRRTLKGRRGKIVGLPTNVLRDPPHAGQSFDSLAVHQGEQSNTSILVDSRLILKVFRRLMPGENPDLEIGRFLTESARPTCVPRLAGALVYSTSSGPGEAMRANPPSESFTIGVLHEFVPNQGDAWVYTLDELGRYFERVESEASHKELDPLLLPRQPLLQLTKETMPAQARAMIGSFLESAELLGRRTAELHLALAEGEDSAFRPEPFTRLYQRSLYQSFQAQARRALQLLRRNLTSLKEPARGLADRVLQLEKTLQGCFRELLGGKLTALRMRCHGDFHLGQVLFTGKDFVIIDFEGEPARPVSERRIKTSPLRDVASMLRSFHYASRVALASRPFDALTSGQQFHAGEYWMQIWYSWSAATFLQAYLTKAGTGSFLPAESDPLRTLLDAYLLEKAVYELSYELNNRPEWVQIPLEGILALLPS